jgi:hypothetical protein
VAKFVQSALLGEIRRSAGDLTFGRNRYGPWFKARTFPTNHLTPARAVCRDRWARAQIAWREALTDDDRAAWAAFADRVPPQPGPCNGKPQTARGLFVSSFFQLDTLGLGPITQPPAKYIRGQLRSITAACDANAQSLILTGDQGTDPPEQGLLVSASPPLPITRHWANQLMKQIAAIPPPIVWPLELWPAYIATLGIPDPGTAIVVTAKAIPTLSGFAGVTQKTRCVVQGTGGSMLTKQATLTDAQIRALPTTPVTIIPGTPGYLILPFLAVLELNATAGAYTNVSAGPANQIFTITGTRRNQAGRLDDCLAGPSQKTTILPLAGALDAVPPTVTQPIRAAQLAADAAGQPLQIAASNTGGNLTGGNAANTLRVTVYYLLQPAA